MDRVQRAGRFLGLGSFANGAELPGGELDGREDQGLRERRSTSRDSFRLDVRFRSGPIIFGLGQGWPSDGDM